MRKREKRFLKSIFLKTKRRHDSFSIVHHFSFSVCVRWHLKIKWIMRICRPLCVTCVCIFWPTLRCILTQVYRQYTVVNTQPSRRAKLHCTHHGHPEKCVRYTPTRSLTHRKWLWTHISIISFITNWIHPTTIGFHNEIFLFHQWTRWDCTHSQV